MGSYQIDIRFADGSRRRCRHLNGDLGEACGVALALAEEEVGMPDIADPAWIELYEGDTLHLSISIVPGSPFIPGSARQPPA